MAFISNFIFLQQYDEYLFRLGQAAERYFASDPNTSQIKMRQLGEAIAQNIAARVGVEYGKKITQCDLIYALDNAIGFDKNVKDAFHTLRLLGNEATHEYLSHNHRDALKLLQIGYALAGWFFITFAPDEAKNFKLKKFVKPEDPSEYVRQLEAQLASLIDAAKRSEDRIKLAEQVSKIEGEKAEAEKLRADRMAEENEVWQELAEESEQKLQALQQQVNSNNQNLQKVYFAKSEAEQKDIRQHIAKSPFEMNEAETRVLIDEQLNAFGWLADSVNLHYNKGTRPQANKNMAIAEWPTDSGPADYVLFIGLTPVAVVEAKRSLVDVYGAVDQAKRYAKDINANGDFEQGAEYGQFKVPFVFATNGRAYLEQLKEKSGIWYMDVRDTTNRRRAIKSWFKPYELQQELRSTKKQAEQKLDEMDFNYTLQLRPYQQQAILAVEQAIKNQQQRALVAMATGTGKTKTCIALIYRLLKAERFRRILFLVDRSALGVQASVDFGEVAFAGDTKFADTFEVLGMKPDKKPVTKPNQDTKVHVATVQGLVKRLLYPSDGEEKIGIGEYDCIVVDECHRGYLLDRFLGDTEMEFRDQADYQSKYRAVIDYFDAFKIGLTATPALHTTEIFGSPVFSYSYPEAVVDGYLVDHLPPIRIHTLLNEKGISYKINEPVQVYHPDKSQIETFNTPDELSFDVAEFNRKIITPQFTQAVADWLIRTDAIDPYSPAKTLVFCVSDHHADQMVEALHDACDRNIGGVDDDAIKKITGKSDKPLELIRLYKNDRLPNIAVTVDLLTTGIDVPEICNLVFMRRVNSRILYEQMLGRATRRADGIAKERFRIYDAVDIYAQLEDVNTMKPVVTNVDISFTDLVEELINCHEPRLQQLAKNQFLAKLQSKKRYLTDDQLEDFSAITGQSPQQFAEFIKQLPVTVVADWFRQNPGLGEVLDAKVKSGKGPKPIYLSNHHDEVTHTSTGYGDGQKPEDYLQAFNDFVKANSNRLAAMQVVVQRPWALTRKDLRELAKTLDENHFREQDLQVAWHEVNNQEIAARIIGFIRQAAIGEAPMPYELRVDRALQRILAKQSWQTPQRKWLEAIANQIKANTIVEQESLSQGYFQQRLGGIKRAEKLFEQPIGEILIEFNKALWVDDDKASA